MNQPTIKKGHAQQPGKAHEPKDKVLSHMRQRLLSSLTCKNIKEGWIQPPVLWFPVLSARPQITPRVRSKATKSEMTVSQDKTRNITPNARRLKCAVNILQHRKCLAQQIDSLHSESACIESQTKPVAWNLGSSSARRCLWLPASSR